MYVYIYKLLALFIIYARTYKERVAENKLGWDGVRERGYRDDSTYDVIQWLNPITLI